MSIHQSMHDACRAVGIQVPRQTKLGEWVKCPVEGKGRGNGSGRVMINTDGKTRKGEDAARKWAYGIWVGCYPDAKLPFGWFDMPIPNGVDHGALSLVEREVKRFRKNKRRAA